MNSILFKFAHLGLNSRAFTEQDFYRLCEAEKIQIIETDEPFSWWMTLDGQSYIVLNRNLRGYKLLFTMLHELSHHYLHGGCSLNAIKSFGSNRRREEREADFFATLAVYPLPVLLSGELVVYEAHDPYLCIIRQRREEIYRRFGL